MAWQSVPDDDPSAPVEPRLSSCKPDFMQGGERGNGWIGRSSPLGHKRPGPPARGFHRVGMEQCQGKDRGGLQPDLRHASHPAPLPVRSEHPSLLQGRSSHPTGSLKHRLARSLLFTACATTGSVRTRRSSKHRAARRRYRKPISLGCSACASSPWFRGPSPQPRSS